MSKDTMLKFYIIGLSLLSLTAFFLAINSSSDIREVRQQLTEKTRQLEEKEKIIKELQAKIEEKNKKIEKLAKENIVLAKKLKQIEEKIKKANKTLRRKGIKIKLPQGGIYISPETGENILAFANTMDKSIEKLLKTMADVPIGVPLYGKITSRFGYRKDPFTRKRAFHTGLDLKARYKQPVFATANGVVEYAGWMKGYGKIVIIRHKYGFKTYYGHLSKIRVKKGQYVKVGSVIGYAGNTGRSTGTHLHYEIRRYGALINPLRLMYLNRTNSF
ncbi:M23 family metallopeptidase [Persephonella sp. IF05-L8]|uniref:peptidoglycan DD-metalloendopeptidase family protein n=1 Tax=Persephonella sp. IF05-L8 TaxID=1158338 RepID=UPI00068FAC79